MARKDEGSKEDAETTSEERTCAIDSKTIVTRRTERPQYTGVWYGTRYRDARLQGVALFKEFDPEFLFALTEYRNGGDDDDSGVCVEVDVKI